MSDDPKIPGWVHGVGVAFDAADVRAVRQTFEQETHLNDETDLVEHTVVDVVQVFLASGAVLPIRGVTDVEVLASIAEALNEVDDTWPFGLGDMPFGHYDPKVAE